MLYDIWARAQAKWRGIVVYSLLQAVTRFITAVIYHQSGSPGLQLYASVVSLATNLFCVFSLWRLLTADSEGDESWPPIWS